MTRNHKYPPPPISEFFARNGDWWGGMPLTVVLQRKDGSWPGRPHTDLPVHWVPYDAWRDLVKLTRGIN